MSKIEETDIKIVDNENDTKNKYSSYESTEKKRRR
jgi:hypothetical protein